MASNMFRPQGAQARPSTQTAAPTQMANQATKKRQAKKAPLSVNSDASNTLLRAVTAMSVQNGPPSLSAPSEPTAYASLSTSVDRRRAALASAVPNMPTLKNTQWNQTAPGFERGAARAAYCKSYTIGKSRTLVGELMPSWVFSEEPAPYDTKQLVAKFTQLRLNDTALESALTNNGTYVSDLSSPLCDISMAETTAISYLASLDGGGATLPYQMTVAFNNKELLFDEPTFEVVGYRCLEDASNAPKYPFLVFPFSDTSLGFVEALPDFHAAERCEKPEPTSTYYFASVATLGLYGTDGQLARDALAPLSQTPSTLSASPTATKQISAFTGLGSAENQIHRAISAQRTQNMAFAAWNLLLFGALTAMFVLVRRKLQ